MFLYWEYYLTGIILIPGIILGIYAQVKVNSSFNKYLGVCAECGKTASQIAQSLLTSAGLNNIKIVRVGGHLTDYYNHKRGIIALSEDVYDSTSISAIGVACHEVGHALQYKTGYLPIKLRNFFIPIFNFANSMLWVLILLGIILFYTNVGPIFLWIGVGVFGLSVVINLVTLPVEYNASNNALKILQTSTILTADETKCAKEVLYAAALTYVAGLVVSILNLLRLVILIGRRRD